MVAPSWSGVQLGNDASDDGFRGCERVAPDAKNPPPTGAKKPRCATIAGTVAGDFAPPVFTVFLGHAAVPPASVPEAAINEDREALARENEVGVARERLVPPPASDARRAQYGCQLHLGVLVAAGTDGGHDLRALML